MHRIDLDGPPIRTQDDALDLIAATFGSGDPVVVVPVERLDPDFFRLASGVAGEIVQKFVNYRVRLVVLGDVREHVTRSDSFRDWVYEVNRGRDIWFVADEASLEARLV